MDPFVPKAQQLEGLKWILSVIPLDTFIHALDVLERNEFVSSRERNSLVTVAQIINREEKE